MLIHWIWLSQLAKIPADQKLTLLHFFRDPEDIYRAEEAAVKKVEGITAETLAALESKDLSAAHQILRQCDEKNISILTYGDGAYPISLKNIADPPLVLYYKGCLPDWHTVPAIGIVGTRRATPYGMQIAQTLGYQIAGCGALVLSGGADGIDTQALLGALRSGKKVVAVLGFGADIIYPARNRELFHRIQLQGCLITEYPPGTPAYSWNFLQRNRLISGLSNGVLVVEAPARSGALNTAAHARDQGRDVFVVPGNINVPACAGSNALLQDYAFAVFTGWDVVSSYQCLYPHTVRRFDGAPAPAAAVAQTRQLPQQPVGPAPEPRNKSIDNPDKSNYSVIDNKQQACTAEEEQVLKCLSATPRYVDEVIAESQLPAGTVLSALTTLALKGLVENHPGRRISLK